MISISLCMIVRDEEEVLDRCLSSVADLVDEIIIVDTGSTDHTKEIASSYTSRIYDFEWIDDFAKARNYAFSKAVCDYCMWMDADDVMEPEDRTLFKQLKKSISHTTSVVMMPYHAGFDEQGNVTFSYYRERIIKNHTGMKWVGAVHEVIPPVGEVVYEKCAICHRKNHSTYSDRNLRIFERQVLEGKTLDLRQRFYYGRELYYHKRYEDALRVFDAFLEEKGGWLENRIDACCHRAYCFEAMGQREAALLALLHSMTMDLPRAEVCCEIGRLFMGGEQWQQAAFWYTIATTCKQDEKRGGFTSPDCYGYLPCIQLCVCYSQLGELEKAIRFNELAATYKPESRAVLHNRQFFESELKKR